MAPKKQAAQPVADAPQAASSRPRRTCQPRKCNVPELEDIDDDDANTSEAEEEPKQRGRRPSGRQASQRQAALAVTPSAKHGGTRAAAAGSSRRAAAAQNAPVSDASDEEDEDVNSGTDADEEERPATRHRSTRAASAAATTRSAAGSRRAVPPVTAAKASAKPAQPAANRTAATGGAKAAAARAVAGTKAHAQQGDSEAEKDAEDNGSGDDEEEEEEEEAAVAAAAAAAAGPKGRARRGRGASSHVSTCNASRKRLFELLERRVGNITGDGGTGGRRVMYADLPAKNPTKKAKLLVDLRSQFDDWHSRLRSNFSVLLYGFGSKRGLLDEFAKMLAGPRNRGDAAVLVFHGYNPRCNAREVVTAVAGALMQRTFRIAGAAGAGGGGAGSSAPAALRALVDEIRQEPLERHVFVVVHNLDGPGLRPDVSLLSSLAACPQVHLIASVDHALAPLLWDSADAARFRWQYINATTFQPYLAETSGMESVLLGAFKSGVVTAGAGTVLRSLVIGAQEVFRLLAEHLLEDPECEGVAFAHLYRMCKERFLVRDEQVLRQHLVEFIDHELVRTRPASDDAGELLTIPMTPEDMREVLDDLAAARGQAQ